MITLTPYSATITPNGSGNLDSANPSGEVLSGGNAALGWIATGLSNGDQITISTDGTNNFGTKAQAAPVLMDGCTNAYENGVKNTFRETMVDGDIFVDNSTNSSELYFNASTLKLNTTTRPLRNSFSGGHYIGNDVKGQGFIEAPIAAGGKAVSVPEHNNHYMAWFERYGYDFMEMHNFVYSGKVGTYSTPADLNADPEALGEFVTLDNAVTARVISDDGTRLCIYTPGYRLQMNELANTVITGVTSGATSTVVENSSGPGITDVTNGPEKVSRLWSSSDGNSGFRHTWNRTANAMTGTGGTSDTYGDINSIDNASFGRWSFFECIVNLDTDTVTIAMQGAVISELDISTFTGVGGVWDKTDGLYLAEIGWQPIRCLFNIIEFTDVYLDHVFNRVYLGNAAVWEDCTIWELQRPTGWLVDEVIFDIQQGSLSNIEVTPAFAYIVTDDYPDPLATGLEIG